MSCIKKEQQRRKSTSTRVTHCGRPAEENGFTFALNYPVHGLKSCSFFFSFFFFQFFHCYSMCFILFYASLSERLTLLHILHTLSQRYSNGLLNAPLYRFDLERVNICFSPHRL